MRAVLVYPDIVKGANWPGYYYVGIGYLIACLQEAGHEVDLLHITGEPDEQEFKRALSSKLGPGAGQLVGFSATTNMFGFVARWSAWAKEEFEVFTVAGGVHPTLSPDEAIACPSLDAICVGEGEGALVELADALDAGKSPASIRNLWVMEEGKITRNSVRPLVDLDSLPRPNRSLFNYEHLELEAEGRGVFMASRGCPYRCAYCSNEALMAVYGSRRDYVRFRGVANIIEEIEAVVAQYPFIRTIHFDDDILPLRPEWFEEFATVYGRRIGLPFECNVRPNLINPKVTALLKQAGCRQVRLGIESGNDHIRNKVLKRGLTDERMVTAGRLLREAGILVYNFNMVGMPFEGPRAMLETVKLNAEVGFDDGQASIFEPFPQTELYAVCRDNGIISGAPPTDYHRDSMLKMAVTRRRQVLFFAYFFPLLVRIYGLLKRLPLGLAPAAVWVVDTFLVSRLAAWLVFPILVGLYRTLRRHRRLEKLVRDVSRRLLYRTEVSARADRN